MADSKLNKPLRNPRLPVQKIDPTTNEILKTYSSMKEAAFAAHLHYYKILKACQDPARPVVAGFIWRFEKEPLVIEAGSVKHKVQVVTDIELALLKRNLPDGINNNKQALDEFIALHDNEAAAIYSPNPSKLMGRYSKAKRQELEMKNKEKLTKQEVVEDNPVIEQGDEEEIDIDNFSLDSSTDAHLSVKELGRSLYFKKKMMKKEPFLKLNKDQVILKRYDNPEELERDGYDYYACVHAMSAVSNYYKDAYWKYESIHNYYLRAMEKRSKQKMIEHNKTKMSDIKKLPHLKRGLRFT